MPARMLVFGFSVTLLNIFPPLINGPGDGNRKGDHSQDWEDGRCQGADSVERVRAYKVIVCHGFHSIPAN